MDKNASTGFILIMLILLAWYYFFSPTPPQQEAKDVARDSTQTSVKPKATISPETKDSLDKIQVGDFAGLVATDNQNYTVKTEEMTVTFESKGGNIQHLSLNHHLDQHKKPLDIIPVHAENRFAEEFTYDDKVIRTDMLRFTPKGNLPSQVSSKDSVKISFVAALDSAHYIEKRYTLYGDTYQMGYSFRTVGLQQKIKDNSYLLHWKNVIPCTEKALTIQRQKTTIAYADTDDVEKMSFSDSDSETPETPIRWLAYRSQFFTTSLIPAQNITKSTLSFYTPTDERISKIMDSKLTLALDKTQNTTENNFRLFTGPLDYYTLKSYNNGLHKQADLGWGPVKYINMVTMWVFKKLEGLNFGYGLIIFLFGILIKLVVFPMTYKSFVSMAKLKVLNQLPEMKELDVKYADDAQKAQMEKMAIYNSMGVSPLGGCLPMLLQYPIIISVFFLFPQAYELRHKSFLWADDLSTYDSIFSLPFSIPGYGDHVSLFTILMAISTFIFTYYNQSSQPTAGNSQMQMQMKIMMYIMPVFLLFFLNSYASGLSWYYFISNLLAVAQTLAFRYFIDDSKLEAQLHEVKKQKAANPKAKSKLSQWVEEQQKKQQGNSKK